MRQTVTFHLTLQKTLNGPLMGLAQSWVLRPYQPLNNPGHRSSLDSLHSSLALYCN